MKTKKNEQQPPSELEILIEKSRSSEEGLTPEERARAEELIANPKYSGGYCFICRAAGDFELYKHLAREIYDTRLCRDHARQEIQPRKSQLQILLEKSRYIPGGLTREERARAEELIAHPVFTGGFCTICEGTTDMDPVYADRARAIYNTRLCVRHALQEIKPRRYIK
jgi:hypothetical protein